MPVPVDIVLPCYNPNDSWPLELICFNDFVKGLYSVNYIIVNDGSTDNKIPNQIEHLKQNGIAVKYLSYEKNHGKGFALRHGVKIASSEFIVCTDIDFPFTNQSMSWLFSELIKGNYDVVSGNRNDVYYQKKMSIFRKSLSKVFRYFSKRILRMSISDTQCGLKGFNKKGKEKFLSTRINRYLFDFEFIYLSSNDNTLKIAPAEVQLKDNVVFSKMRLKIIIQEFFNLMYVLLFRKA